MMKRRTLIGAGGLWVAPWVVHAQPARRLYRVGILALGTAANMRGPTPRSTSDMAALLRGMRELGHVYGEHFVTEPRGTKGRPERYPELAAELIDAQVDVIVAAGPALFALKQATSTTPSSWRRQGSTR